MPFMEDPLFPGGTVITDDSGNRADVPFQGWERITTHFNRKEDTSIDARDTLSLADHTGAGFMIGVVLIANTKNKLKLRVQFDDQVTYFDLSPEDAHTYLCTGIGSTTVSSGLGIGSNIWNPVEGYYGIIFAPGKPLTYRKHLEVWIENVDDSSHTVLDAWILWAQLED